MANVMLEILDDFLWNVKSSDVPTFKLHVFLSYFEFWIGVSEY